MVYWVWQNVELRTISLKRCLLWYCPPIDKRVYPVVWICSRNKLVQVGKSNCQFKAYLLLFFFWQFGLTSCVNLFPCVFADLPPQKDCYKVSPSYFTTYQTFFIKCQCWIKSQISDFQNKIDFYGKNVPNITCLFPQMWIFLQYWFFLLFQ